MRQSANDGQTGPAAIGPATPSPSPGTAIEVPTAATAAAMAPIVPPMPAPMPAPEAVAPTVALSEPAPGALLSGAARLAASVSPDVERVQFLLSDGGPDWQPVADAPPRLAVAEWDTLTTPDGTYWLTALATNGAGLGASAEPTLIVVANSP